MICLELKVVVVQIIIQALEMCLMLKISSLKQWSPPSSAARNLDLTTIWDGYNYDIILCQYMCSMQYITKMQIGSISIVGTSRTSPIVRSSTDKITFSPFLKVKHLNNQPMKINFLSRWSAQ